MLLRSRPQICLFSATYPNSVREFVLQFAPDSNRITLVGQSIIFVQPKQTADEAVNKRTQEEHSCAVLHGGLSPNERDSIMEEFRLGKAKVLIATNVLSRGIDVIVVDLVINYDLPVMRLDDEYVPDFETYGISTN